MRLGFYIFQSPQSIYLLLMIMLLNGYSNVRTYVNVLPPMPNKYVLMFNEFSPYRFHYILYLDRFLTL